MWEPSEARVVASNMTALRGALERRWGVTLQDYPALWRFSVDHMEAFWQSIWELCEVVGEPGARVLVDAEHMPGARFFPDAQLSFTDNLLRRDDDGDAIVSLNELGERRTMSWAELTVAVSREQLPSVEHVIDAVSWAASLNGSLNAPPYHIAPLAWTVADAGSARKIRAGRDGREQRCSPAQ
jgi:hypothetical protein